MLLVLLDKPSAAACCPLTRCAQARLARTRQDQQAAVDVDAFLIEMLHRVQHAAGDEGRAQHQQQVGHDGAQQGELHDTKVPGKVSQEGKRMGSGAGPKDGLPGAGIT
jgi:protein-disulfide isomerase-like protein with CxxC motif